MDAETKKEIENLLEYKTCKKEEKEDNIRINS